MDKPYKQIVTIFVNADVQGADKEPYYNVSLINFSGQLSISDSQSDDIRLINEAVDEWSRDVDQYVQFIADLS